jgi:hypothetical protein
MRPERDKEGSKKIFLPKAPVSDIGRTDPLSLPGEARIGEDIRSLKRNAAAINTKAAIVETPGGCD